MVTGENGQAVYHVRIRSAFRRMMRQFSPMGVTKMSETNTIGVPAVSVKAPKIGQRSAGSTTAKSAKNALGSSTVIAIPKCAASVDPADVYDAAKSVQAVTVTRKGIHAETGATVTTKISGNADSEPVRAAFVELFKMEFDDGTDDKTGAQ